MSIDAEPRGADTVIQEARAQSGSWPAVRPGGEWIAVRQDGARLQLWTGPRALRYQRIQIQAIALAFAVGGGLLLRLSAWAWLAVAVAPVLWALASRLAPERPLVEIDRHAGLLTPLAGSGAEGRPIPLGRISAIAGAWETFGWSSRSAIYAIDGQTERSLILALGGTNDAYAVAVCAALGQELGVSADYTGPSGEPVRCGVTPTA
ncbi:MAG: hypothetical protein IPJ58_03035 [Ardenticatenia bacterium]|nr:hypothetical protein [Ardenticatenia bacterium]HRA21027.1 hypothetical protein [Anaerolineae bacterium]